MFVIISLGITMLRDMGNLAWKLDDDVILITPTKHNKGEVSRDNVVFINRAGETIEGKVKPTGETPMYVNFFRERPDVQAVLHCHPPHLNAFAISDSRITTCVHFS